MTMQTKTTDRLLPSDLRLRAVQWADLKPVAQLILEVCSADGDPTTALSNEELEREWKSPEFNIETDAWVVESSAGGIIGYETFMFREGHASLMGDGYVHPDFRRRSIGTAMLRALEGRARLESEKAAPDLRVFIRNGMMISDAAGRELHEHEGYQAIRYQWRMETELNEAPPAIALPEGIELRPFLKGIHDRAVWQADTEAFRDHWGSRPIPFETWSFRRLALPDFDPSLWHIAWDGDEIAGFSECRYRMGMGWVGTLGVRRPWRKKGLGLALLYRSFQEFYERGTLTVGLGVDAQNPTGATRLYKKAGMKVAAEFVIYEKELRPGREMDES